MTAPPITIYWQFLKQTLNCIIPHFHGFAVWDWNDLQVLLYTVWLCHLIFNKHTSILCVPNISQTLATIYQLQPNEVIAVAVKKRLCDSQLVTVKICYCNGIDYIQKCCINV